MDHLAPPSGVICFNYNSFGEMLAGSIQLPPMELGGLDVGRQIASQVYAADPQGTLTNGMHYVQDGQNTSMEMVHLPHPEPVILPLTETKAANRVRTAFGEKIACQECGSTFACAANLRNHLRIHSGERPFVCEECGASFTQSSNLRAHKRVHTGERPYMCGICGQTFSRSSHLPGHMRTHTGERPFICPHCNRSFASNQIMKNHMRTHTGERPFVCEVCGATFGQSSCLATHKKIHTGERKYQCRECGKAFISRSGLQTHERVHTGEKPFNCEKCGKAFKTSSYLSKHKQKYCGNNGNRNKVYLTPRRMKVSKKVQKEGENSETQVKPATKFSKRLLIKRLRRSHRLRTAEFNDEADEGEDRVDENGAFPLTKLEESEVKTEEVEALGSNLDSLNNGMEPVQFQDCRSQENQDPLELHYSDDGCSDSLSNIKLADDQCQTVTHSAYTADQVCGLRDEFLDSSEYRPDENLQFSASQALDEKAKSVLEGPWCSMNQS
ncbi:endothelial zinc finger protein induced by tumor necrosis factor alpha-like isoform X1 [Palaemon carinicauda]|uniref:endothelial zinc finger protein induced by tumor necrosis factor alpha-like isoform X1 n=1 Tax=Palaemon carinicauda TaxID=392227 RepID=UPI0035B6173E